MTIRPRLGTILAGSAVVVAMPRHIVAALHAAGLPVVRDESWRAVVIVSAVALAALEALTMGYVSRARLPRYVWLMLTAISLTFAPSVVADSAGLSLVELTGTATLAHYAWSAASVAATLLIVRAAGAADDAIAREQQAIADQTARGDRAQQAMTDTIDDLRQAVAGLQQGGQAIAAQNVTVNVAANTPPEATGSDSRPVTVETWPDTQAAREVAVFVALRDGHRTLPAVAEAAGLTISQVRRTTHWQKRQHEVTG